MANLIKLFITRKKLLQHESKTPIESKIISSQILQIKNYKDLKNVEWESQCFFDQKGEQSTIV